MSAITHLIASGTDESQNVLAFTETASDFCDETDIAYSLIVTPATVGQDTSFISFNANTMEVSWPTADFGDVGTYTVAIRGTITSTTVDFVDSSF